MMLVVAPQPPPSGVDPRGFSHHGILRGPWPTPVVGTPDLQPDETQNSTDSASGCQSTPPSQCLSEWHGVRCRSHSELRSRRPTRSMNENGHRRRLSDPPRISPTRPRAHHIVQGHSSVHEWSSSEEERRRQVADMLLQPSRRANRPANRCAPSATAGVSVVCRNQAPPEALALAADDGIMAAAAVVLSHMAVRPPPEPIRQGPDSEPRPATVFHLLHLPRMHVSDYFARLRKYFDCSNECFVIALVYIDRLVKFNPQLSVDGASLHRLFFVASMVAVKWHDDDLHNNGFYHKVGGLELSEVNMLERRFLRLMFWTLNVDVQEYSFYREMMLMASVDQSKGLT